LVAVAATDGAEYEKRSTENNTLLGEEGKALFDEFFKPFFCIVKNLIILIAVDSYIKS